VGETGLPVYLRLLVAYWVSVLIFCRSNDAGRQHLIEKLDVGGRGLAAQLLVGIQRKPRRLAVPQQAHTMYSYHVRIPSAANRRSAPVAIPDTGAKKPLKVVRKKRPAFMEPEPPAPVPAPIPPLPVSPPPSPSRAEEVEAPTPRPVILIGLPDAKRPLPPAPTGVPAVDSAIESPGFRPEDDAVVRRKQEDRYWAEEEEEEEASRGYDCFFGWRQPPFTDAMGERISRVLSAHVQNVACLKGPAHLSAIEQLLHTILATERLIDFLEWAPRFSVVLEKKVREFHDDPLATDCIRDKCQRILDSYFP
jgi:hypothetical protein